MILTGAADYSEDQVTHGQSAVSVLAVPRDRLVPRGDL